MRIWEVLCIDHGRLLQNSVRWAANNEESPVSVSGPGLLDVTVWRQKSSITVHMVNLTNPMTMKGPYRYLIPAGRSSEAARRQKACERETARERSAAPHA
jgi:hypothetical protein